jgi:hypothetical protein
MVDNHKVYRPKAENGKTAHCKTTIKKSRQPMVLQSSLPSVYPSPCPFPAMGEEGDSGFPAMNLTGQARI